MEEIIDRTEELDGARLPGVHRFAPQQYGTLIYTLAGEADRTQTRLTDRQGRVQWEVQTSPLIMPQRQEIFGWQTTGQASGRLDTRNTMLLAFTTVSIAQSLRVCRCSGEARTHARHGRRLGTGRGGRGITVTGEPDKLLLAHLRERLCG